MGSTSSPLDPWAVTLACLQRVPLPVLPALPGRVHRIQDAPLTDADLAGITSPTELALVAGITRQAAVQRLQRQAELRAAEDTTTTTTKERTSP